MTKASLSTATLVAFALAGSAAQGEDPGVYGRGLSFDTGETFGDHGWIGFATRQPIRMGQTGAIDLAWVPVNVEAASDADFSCGVK